MAHILPNVKDEPRPARARLVQHHELQSEVSFRKKQTIARGVTEQDVGSGALLGDLDFGGILHGFAFDAWRPDNLNLEVADDSHYFAVLTPVDSALLLVLHSTCE